MKAQTYVEMLHAVIPPPLSYIFHVKYDRDDDPVERSHPYHHHFVTQLLLDKITILSYAASPPLLRPTHLNQP